MALAPSSPAPLTIDVTADLVCPWCFIGTRRLQKVLSAVEGPVEVSYRPYLLDPSTPAEGVDLRERLQKKYGVNPRLMFGRVEAAARQAGIPLDFSKVRRSVSTLKAHTLLSEALRRGTQHALAEALYAAYFLEGRDIGQSSVLMELAAGHGFQPAEVEALLSDPNALEATRAQAQAAADGGIRGVPYFVLGGRLAVSGAQPEEVFREAIRQAKASPSSSA